jgi:hypothetical protein
MLWWLIAHEWRDEHFSFTPVGGAGPHDRPPGFDQQPIEAATMADACVHAFDRTGDECWLEKFVAANQWFHGLNDGARVMFDAATGGGYDGLTRDGVNTNQGAESTLAYVATQRAYVATERAYVATERAYVATERAYVATERAYVATELSANGFPTAVRSDISVMSTASNADIR